MKKNETFIPIKDLTTICSLSCLGFEIMDIVPNPEDRNSKYAFFKESEALNKSLELLKGRKVKVCPFKYNQVVRDVLPRLKA